MEWKNWQLDMNWQLQNYLFERCRRGIIDDVVRFLCLSECRVHVNTPNRLTLLYVACEQGHDEIVRFLLDIGAYVDNGKRYKPLIAAVRYNHYQCVKVLLQNHADANCHNSRGETPMSVALQYHPNDIELILLLLRYGARPIPPASLADIAVQLLNHAKEEHTQAVIKLIDENIINWITENIFPAAFQFVFEHGSMELAERMLANDTYRRNEHLYQESAVYLSAKNNWLRILSDLIEKRRVDLNALTGGETLLFAACAEGHKDVVSLLLDNGADPNVPNELAGDIAPCGTADPDPEFVIRDRKPTLGLPLVAAVDKGNIDIMKTLVNVGADINAMDMRGENVVRFATKNLSLLSNFEFDMSGTFRKMWDLRKSTVRWLVKHGATFNMQLPYGSSPLYIPLAVARPASDTYDVVELMQLMAENGAMLQDSNPLPAYVSYIRDHSLDSGPLMALTSFDDSHE